MSQEQRMALSESKLGQAVAHVMLICPSQTLWAGADEVAERWLPLWKAALAHHKAAVAPEPPVDHQWPRGLDVPKGLSFAQWLKATGKVKLENAVSMPNARYLMRKTLAHLADRDGDDELKRYLRATDVLPDTTGSD